MARRVLYRHPHYPEATRTGVVLSGGVSGIVVRDDERGDEVRVRHHDVLEHLSGTDDDDDFGEGLQKSWQPWLGMGHAELATIGEKYANQYDPKHPANYQSRLKTLKWRFEPRFPLERLPGQKSDWTQFNRNHGRNLGFATTQEPPIVVVRGRDEHHYIWDGNHRVAEAHAAGLTHVPAIVGWPADRHQDGYFPPGAWRRSGVRKSQAPLLLLKSSGRAGHPLRLRTAQQRVGGRVGAGKTAATQRGAQEQRVRDQAQQASLPAWTVKPPLPHEVGHFVQYQRPDMPSAEYGQIHAVGKHGAIVTRADGVMHKVRWEHVHGGALTALQPEERDPAAEALQRQGVPIHPFERLLLPDRTEGPNPQLMARIKALVDDGAPINTKALAGQSATTLRRLVAHFAGPVPDEDESQPERPAAAKAKPRPNPYHEEEW